jgi:hypothetical protein
LAGQEGSKTSRKHGKRYACVLWEFIYAAMQMCAKNRRTAVVPSGRQTRPKISAKLLVRFSNQVVLRRSMWVACPAVARGKYVKRIMDERRLCGVFVLPRLAMSVVCLLFPRPHPSQPHTQSWQSSRTGSKSAGRTWTWTRTWTRRQRMASSSTVRVGRVCWRAVFIQV